MVQSRPCICPETQVVMMMLIDVARSGLQATERNVSKRPRYRYVLCHRQRGAAFVNFQFVGLDAIGQRSADLHIGVFLRGSTDAERYAAVRPHCLAGRWRLIWGPSQRLVRAADDGAMFFSWRLFFCSSSHRSDCACIALNSPSR